MSTIFNNLFSINGVIDTGNSVLQNMNEIASACGTWITYDINQGKWAVVINQAGSPIVNFNDANIVGGISISSTSLTEVYNAVEIEFPHKDLRDQKDYIKLSIPTIDRYPNEPDNVLSIKTELINEPIQAELIAARELKQSRVDKVIQFRTDYTTLELSAGDLISVTNTIYGFTSKVFRIIKIDEEDADDGTIIFSITALEYSAGIYSTAGLVRGERNRNSGIASKSVNAAVQASDYAATNTVVRNGFDTLLQLTPAAIAQGLNLYFNNGVWFIDYGGKTVSINANDVVVSWTYPDGIDLDIRCRLISPAVGQNVVSDALGYTTLSRTVWPIGASGGSSGSAYIEWGGDNTGPGGDPTKVESVRMDIDRIKAVFPTKRYFVLECRGNWYATRGSQAVKLVAKLYEGGTTTSTGSPTFNFTNAGSTRSRTLAGVEVFVDSFHGGTVEADGFDGGTAPGDLMGYFIFDTQTTTAQFTLEVPPYALT
jgi:hypothetical protein